MVGLIIITAGLHVFATIELYYWTTEWYDFMMHFLGGLWIALFTLWFDSWIPLPIRPNTAFRLIGFVTIVGIAWEFYEIIFNMTFVADKGYVWDTTHDIIMDFVGGVFGWFFVHKKLLNKNE